MRKPDIVIMSSRDRQSVRERLAFVQAEEEKIRLAEDHIEYEKYRKTFEDEQRRQPPAYCLDPLDFETWRSYAPEDESNSGLRGALATQRSLVSRTVQLERDVVSSGKDAALVLP